MSVEQVTIKRGGVGLRALDPAKAWPGYTLFAPSTGSTVYLIDLVSSVIESPRPATGKVPVLATPKVPTAPTDVPTGAKA